MCLKKRKLDGHISQAINPENKNIYINKKLWKLTSWLQRLDLLCY